MTKLLAILTLAGLVFAAIFAANIGKARGRAIETEAYTTSTIRLARLDMDRDRHALAMAEDEATFESRVQAARTFNFAMATAGTTLAVGGAVLFLYWGAGVARIDLEARALRAGLIQLNKRTGQYPLLVRDNMLSDPNVSEVYALTGERQALPERVAQTNAIRASVVQARYWTDELKKPELVLPENEEESYG